MRLRLRQIAPSRSVVLNIAGGLYPIRSRPTTSKCSPKLSQPPRNMIKRNLRRSAVTPDLGHNRAAPGTSLRPIGAEWHSRVVSDPGFLLQPRLSRCAPRAGIGIVVNTRIPAQHLAGWTSLPDIFKDRWLLPLLLLNATLRDSRVLEISRSSEIQVVAGFRSERDSQRLLASLEVVMSSWLHARVLGACTRRAVMPSDPPIHRLSEVCDLVSYVIDTVRTADLKWPARVLAAVDQITKRGKQFRRLVPALASEHTERVRAEFPQMLVWQC